LFAVDFLVNFASCLQQEENGLFSKNNKQYWDLLRLNGIAWELRKGAENDVDVKGETKAAVGAAEAKTTADLCSCWLLRSTKK
jgi:hypothetical protein